MVNPLTVEFVVETRSARPGAVFCAAVLNMAACGMEILTSILAAAATEIGRNLCRCIFPKIKSTVRFKANLRDLEKEKKRMMDLMNDIKQQLESAEKIGRSPTPEVKIWLRDADEFVANANSVQAGVTVNDTRLYGCHCHCSQRIRLGSEVGKLLKEVETLLKAGSFPDGVVSVNDLEKPVEYLPGPSIEYQTIASRNLAELAKMLEENNVRRIGVWGMGGVGKTTLVRNMNNKLNSTSSDQCLFSIVIWITVSKEVDLKRVQREIADRLNLKMEAEESIERTARRLHQRLEKEKFLLILDDVWDNIDLD
ncbi:hypothetical protein TIFTF001_048711, partial [Ficus carica]